MHSCHTALCRLVAVRSPEAPHQAHVERLLAAVATVDLLIWGDYDQVSFTTTAGQQRFRTLPSARNAATTTISRVACVELPFTLPAEADLHAVLAALCAAPAYEEPVIYITQTLRTLHNRGAGEDNPNKFWNRSAEDWLPAAHRAKQST